MFLIELGLKKIEKNLSSFEFILNGIQKQLSWFGDIERMMQLSFIASRSKRFKDFFSLHSISGMDLFDSKKFTFVQRCLCFLAVCLSPELPLRILPGIRAKCSIKINA